MAENKRCEKKEVLWLPERRGFAAEVKSALERQGFLVKEAGNAVEMLHQLDQRRSDGRPVSGLITGVDLPDIPGPRMLEVVKSRFPRLPVLLLADAGAPVFPGDPASRLADGFFKGTFTGEAVADRLAFLQGPDPFQAELRPARRSKPPARAWGLLRLAEEIDAEGVYRHLLDHPLVTRCEAVQGDYDLAVEMASGVARRLDQAWNDLRKRPDIGQADLLPVIAPPLDETVQQFLSAFRRRQEEGARHGARPRSAVLIRELLLVEIARDRLEAVFPRLACAEGVTSCEAVRGAWQAVVQIQAPHREEIQRLVGDRIEPIDGVLRLRSLKVVRLIEN
ncbi:MAG: hypothetical protein GX442_17345 [Candidatus Riflebacteria bacterium]|nr:hypothetical protein [Candidatus Riflebacteria bacterium]